MQSQKVVKQVTRSKNVTCRMGLMYDSAEPLTSNHKNVIIVNLFTSSNEMQ